MYLGFCCYIFSDLSFTFVQISSVKKFFSYIPDGKEVASCSATLPCALYYPFHHCHDDDDGDDDDDDDDYDGDDTEYDDDDDDDDIAFGRPPKTDRTAIAQSREGEDDGLFGPQYIQTRPPYSYSDHKSFSINILGGIRGALTKEISATFMNLEFFPSGIYPKPPSPHLLTILGSSKRQSEMHKHMQYYHLIFQ